MAVAPQDVPTFREDAAFVPLNSTEIAILGGYCDYNFTLFGDVFTFNTSTNEFKKREIEKGGLSFLSYRNISAQVSENAIFVLVNVPNEKKESLIKYTKGDTRITRLASGE